MANQASFTGIGFSLTVGRGPVFYRLNAVSVASGQIDYFFGKSNLSPDFRILLILTGAWTGQVDIEFSVDKTLWTAVPGESYTANTARFFSG